MLHISDLDTRSQDDVPVREQNNEHRDESDRPMVLISSKRSTGTYDEPDQEVQIRCVVEKDFEIDMEVECVESESGENKNRVGCLE